MIIRCTRVLRDCALVRVASFSDLKAAENYMRRIAAQVPSSYFLCNDRSGTILARFVEPTHLTEKPSGK